MDFKKSQSFRCFKSVCLWSLFGILTVIACFFTGYILTCIAGLIKGSAFAQGFGWIAIVFPTILLTLLLLLCFAIANGYLIFILYMEYVKKSNNLPLFVAEKTEAVFNRIVKSNVIKNIISIISVVSFILNIFISAINFYIIIIALITFGILLVIYKNK